MTEEDIKALQKARDVLKSPRFQRANMYGFCTGLVIVAICALEQILAILEPIMNNVKEQQNG